MGLDPATWIAIAGVAASAVGTTASVLNKPKSPKTPVTKPLEEQAKNRMPMGGTLLTGDVGTATTGTKTLLGA